MRPKLNITLLSVICSLGWGNLSFASTTDVATTTTTATATTVESTGKLTTAQKATIDKELNQLIKRIQQNWKENKNNINPPDTLSDAEKKRLDDTKKALELIDSIQDDEDVRFQLFDKFLRIGVPLDSYIEYLDRIDTYELAKAVEKIAPKLSKNDASLACLYWNSDSVTQNKRIAPYIQLLGTFGDNSMLDIRSQFVAKIAVCEQLLNLTYKNTLGSKPSLGNTEGMSEEELDRAKEAYENAMRNYNLMQKAQKAWRITKDGDCGAEYESVIGSIGGVIGGNCELDRIKTRVCQLAFMGHGGDNPMYSVLEGETKDPTLIYCERFQHEH